MRWRRAATVVRGIGWFAAGLIFCGAAAATFMADATDTLTIVICSVLSLAVLGAAHLVGWWIDKRGDRLVTR
jgi:hypothetical protein